MEPMTISDSDLPPAAALATPGYLMTPFAWVRSDLAPLIARDPSLAAHLFTLDQARMHLVAFALAHVKGTVTPALAATILSASRRAVLSAVLGTPPAGLRGVFDRMPPRVMPRQSYVRLSGLFAESRSAKLLSHTGDIDEGLIDLLSALPPALHSAALLRLRRRCHTLDGLAEGLGFLAARGAVADLDAFARQLGRSRSPREFATLVRTAAEALPLPDALPPARIGAAERIDDPGAIRDVARRWRNCLASLVGNINDGECAFYLWRSDGIEAGCLLRRRGRLGWFVEEIKGPRNREPVAAGMSLILAAFAAAGIPKIAVAETIDDIGGEADRDGRRGLGRRGHDEAEDVEVPDDDGAEPLVDDAVAEARADLLDAILCMGGWGEDGSMAEAA